MEIGITTDIVDSTKYHKGVSNYIRYLIKNIAKIQTNHNFHLIHFQKNSDAIYQLDLKEIIVPRYPILSPGVSKLLTTAIRVPNQLENLDVIHIPEPHLSMLPLYLRSDIKTVLTLHGGHLYVEPGTEPKFYESPKAWAYLKLLGLSFPKFRDKIDMYIAVSNFLKKEMIERLKIPEEKIRVIYEAADEKFRPGNFEKSTDFILSDTPGRELIEIYYKLRKRGIKHKLVVFSVRAANKIAEEMAVRLGLQKDVIIAGYVPDEELIKLYNTADLYVRIPLVERFGIPPLEAMACGCPVVTNNVGSLPEVVGDAGILKNRDDIEGLVNAIYEVLTNEGLRQDMIKKGLERAKMFSWEKTAKETMKVYEEVYNSNS